MPDVTATNGHTVAVDYDAEKHGWAAICRDPGCGLAHAGPVRPNRASAETDAERVHTAKYPPTDPAAIARWNAGNPYNDVPAQPSRANGITWLDTPASFGAEAVLSDGTVMQFTSSSYGNAPVRASSRNADGSWFNMGALDTAKWGIPENRADFRRIVERFVAEVRDQSLGGDVDRFLRGQPAIAYPRTVYVVGQGRTLHTSRDCRFVKGASEVQERTLRGTITDGTMTYGMNWCAECDKRDSAAARAGAQPDMAMKHLCPICKQEAGTVYLDPETHQYAHRHCCEARESMRKADEDYKAGRGEDYEYEHRGAQPQHLDEYIGQPVSGYPSSPAHDARAISQYVERMYGGQPKHVDTGKGHAYRVVLPDGREMYARLDGAVVTLRSEWWPQEKLARRRSQPMTLDEMTAGVAPVAKLALAAPEFEPFDALAAQMPSVPGAASRFDLLAAALGGGGVVVDRAKAMAGPCFDVDLGNGKTATLAEGVMGWLDEPQQEEFCVRREVLNIDEAARDHLRTYIEVAESCSTEDTTTGVASCVSRELAARSVR